MAAVGDVKEYEVGKRCVCDGFMGTIRFVGIVTGTNGVWLGIEWDDVSRGKHSGDHEGIKYFTCSREGSGSFVRPKKISLGCSFIEAVQERYGGSKGEEKEVELFVDVKQVEMVGTDMINKKLSQFDKLQHVSLRGMYVSSAGKDGEIRATTPSIRILNLSCNPLLANWETVASIAIQLPLLTSLDLSENRLLQLPTAPNVLAPSFSLVKELYINKMELQWHQMSVILKMMPQLQDLHVCQNRISDLYSAGESCNEFPETLQLLNLEENRLTDWAQIMKLKHLNRLKTLILNDNQLTSISHSLDRQETGYFPALQSLSISSNCISDWASLNALNCLSSLTELRFKDNPLTRGEPSFMARQMIIARIGRLTSLNSSSVSVRERQLAERQYLKEHAQEWMESETDERKRLAFNQKHPRYSNLVKDQGLPEDALHAKKPATTALKHGLILSWHGIAVTIKCPDETGSDVKEVTKKLPGTMTVQKLKGLLQRMYKVDTSQQKLSYLDDRGDREIEMDDDLKQLSFYSIATGDTILLRW